jgi:hypothetical protein
MVNDKWLMADAKKKPGNTPRRPPAGPIRSAISHYPSIIYDFG